MARSLVLVTMTFVAVLAVVIGMRMSAEAIAVVVGVVCGAAAGIPVGLMVLSMLTGRATGAEPTRQAARYAGGGVYPPVVVIQGGAPADRILSGPYSSVPATVAASNPRHFRVVGESDD